MPRRRRAAGRTTRVLPRQEPTDSARGLGPRRAHGCRRWWSWSPLEKVGEFVERTRSGVRRVRVEFVRIEVDDLQARTQRADDVVAVGIADVEALLGLQVHRVECEAEDLGIRLRDTDDGRV